MHSQNIDEVIEKLENIVNDAISTKNPLGIFAILYLGVTKSVKDGIGKNSFENGPRMERLDVIFADRYLTAYEAFQQSQPCTQAWKTTFNTAKRFDLLALQHMLMGMNAHINLDLGIATAEAVQPQELGSVEADFNKINQMLTAKIDEMQDKLSKVSPLLFLLDWVGKRHDERFAEFSLVKARNSAWKAANRLAHLSSEDKELEINELDGYVSLLNKVIASPGIFFGWLVRFIKMFEEKDVAKVLQLLKD